MYKFNLFASIAGLVLATAPVTALAQGAVTIEEVVVTAQRFEETAQKTPLIISVIGGEELTGITDVRHLQTLDPGVSIAVAGNVPNTFVRGFGSQNATLVQESSVAYNLDGVVLFTPTMITPHIYDLDRIEVLKGPQGTLYGRNASSGVVNLIARAPKLGEADAYVEGEVGNFNLWRVTAAVNVPVSETVAIRLAGNHAEHDGYLSDGSDDQDVTAGRFRLLWQPSDKVSLLLGADAAKTDSVGAGQSINPNPTGDKWIGQIDPRAIAFTPLFVLGPPPPMNFNNEQWGVFGQLDVDLGFANLTVLPAYRDEESDETIYNRFAFRESARTKQKSLEVRLANRTNALRWVVGAYYFKVDQEVASNPEGALFRNPAASVSSLTLIDNEVEAYAAFGELTFSVSDRLRLIGGLRYTHEESAKQGTNNGLAVNGGFNPALDPTDYFFSGSQEDEAVSWKVGAEFDLGPDSLLFATASRGFKAGGNYVARLADTRFRPEYVTAFELGSRNRFLNNTLQVNAELFYWKLKDQQLPFLGFAAGSTSPTLLIANVGRAHSYGADLDIIWNATDNDTFRIGGEYLKAEYDDFVRTVPTFTVLPTTQCLKTPAGPAATTLDCSGFPAIRAPEWSGTASYEHRFELAGDDDITFRVDGVYASSRYLDPVYTPEFRQKAAAQFNASLTYHGMQSSLQVTGWVKNIGDTRVMSGGTEQFLPVVHATLLPPRTYGVTVRKSF